MSNQPKQQSSWPAAYKAFLLDKNESLVLKIAPLALLLGYPEVIVSNIIPIVGEITDVGAFVITLVVIFKTFRAVRRHKDLPKLSASPPLYITNKKR